MPIRLRDRAYFFNRLIGENLYQGFNEALQERQRQSQLQSALQFELQKIRQLDELKRQLRQKQLKEREKALFEIFKEDIKKNPELAKHIKASVYSFEIPRPKVKYFSRIDVGDKIIPLMIFDDGSVKVSAEFVKRLSPKEKRELSLKAFKIQEMVRHNRALEGINWGRLNLQKQRLGLMRQRLGVLKQRLGLEKQRLNLYKQRAESGASPKAAFKKKDNFDKYLNIYLSIDRKIADLQAKKNLLGDNEARQQAIQRLLQRQAEVERLMQLENPEKYKFIKENMLTTPAPPLSIEAEGDDNPLKIFEE